MNKFYIMTAVLSLAAVSPAIAKDEKINFTQDGVTYSYTAEKVGESTVYKGRATPGYPFYFVVRGKQVVGNANGIPVTFSTTEANSKSEATVVAAAR